MDIILKILKTVPFFEHLSENEHKSIIQHISMQFYPAHHILFKKGDSGDSMFIIKSGVVKLSDENGEIAELNSEEFFGEMALMEEKPRMAEAETLSDCEIFILKKEDFKSLMHSDLELAKKVQSTFEARKIKNELK